MGKWRVWQWGVEIGLGSHGQRKMSSRWLATGFDTEQEARDWAAGQPDKSEWGTWDVDRVGGNVVVQCDYNDLPKSFRAACAMAGVVID